MEIKGHTLDGFSLRDLKTVFSNSVLPELVSDRQYASDDPVERKLCAVHHHLMQTNPAYVQIFNKTVQLASDFRKTGVVDRLYALSEDGAPCGNLKALTVLLPHSLSLLRGHYLRYRLSSMVMPHFH